MRPFDQAQRRAGKDVLHRSGEPARAFVPFLQQDTVEGRMFRRTAEALGAMVPLHVEEPFAAVVVMKQRGVEA
ncbi:hypothetical protein D3C72_2394110 [compost metagenome]